MPKYPGRCPVNRELDVYTGCDFGCLYCIARPRHARRSQVAAGPLLALVERGGSNESFRKTGARLSGEQANRAPFYLSPWTDPYQPLEAKEQRTREILRRLGARALPFFVVTRSPLVRRDADLFAGRDGSFVAISVNALDGPLVRRLEPLAPEPEARLEAAREISSMGVRVVVKVDPVIPGLTDGSVLESLLDAACALGCFAVTAETLRLTAAIAARMRPALTAAEHSAMLRHYPPLGSEPLHARLPYRIRLFERIANLVEPRVGRACFCRASLPRPITPWDCRGGFSGPARGL